MSVEALAPINMCIWCLMILPCFQALQVWTPKLKNKHHKFVFPHHLFLSFMCFLLCVNSWIFLGYLWAMSGVGDCIWTIVDANASSKTRFRVFVIVGSVNREVLLWLIASRVRKSKCEIMMEQKNRERCISLFMHPLNVQINL